MKKFMGPKFVWAEESKKVPYLEFRNFMWVLFLEIAYNDSVEQCLTAFRVKTRIKKIGDLNSGQTGQNRVQK